MGLMLVIMTVRALFRVLRPEHHQLWRRHARPVRIDGPQHHRVAHAAGRGDVHRPCRMRMRSYFVLTLTPLACVDELVEAFSSMVSSCFSGSSQLWMITSPIECIDAQIER